MAFHNIRDKYGRFTKKKARASRAKKPQVVIPPLATILNIFLLDDSGSMYNKADATVNGFNEVVDICKTASKTTGVTYRDILVTFGELEYYKWKEGSTYLSMIPAIGKHYYSPSQNGTALYDAILDSITCAENLLKADKDTEYRVVLTVFTDGRNNVNGYKMNQLKLTIEERRNQGWVINFIGAGEDSVIKKEAAKIGIDFTNTLSYVNTSAGTRGAMGKMSAASMNFAEAVSQREEKTVGFFANK